MHLKRLIFVLSIGFITCPLFAAENTNLQNVISLQQAQIMSLSKSLTQTQEAVAKAQKAADGAATAAATADAKAVTAAQSAAAGQNNVFLQNSGGGISCRRSCGNSSAGCIGALAGIQPFETWTCEAAPAGNLLCICVKS